MSGQKLTVCFASLVVVALVSACTETPTPTETPPTTETPIVSETAPVDETSTGTVFPSPTNEGDETPPATVSAVPTALTTTATRTPPPQAGRICASYFRTLASDRMIQGSWTDDPDATSSISACFQYMDREILSEPGCAQPGDALALTVVLIPRSRHTYDMPTDINMSTEFVTSIFCPRTTGTPVSGEGSLICASYFLQPGTGNYIQGSWTDGSDDPSATTSQQGCFVYMEENILQKPYCAQPAPIDHVLIALLTEWRHTFYLPADLDVDTELVGFAECPTPTATRTAMPPAPPSPTKTPPPPATATPLPAATATPGPGATASPYTTATPAS